MARRRRLNKKVALLGAAVLLLFASAAVMAILHLNRDPLALIAEGDAARASHDYQAAIESYRRAYGLTRSLQERTDLLFKLAEAYRASDHWDKVMGCWNAILTADPQNVKARLGQLKYSYILADGLGSAGRSMSGYWEDVLSQARKTMEVIEQAGLGNDEIAKWEPAFGTSESPPWSGEARRLAPHLHFVKGRAAFELAAMGAVTSPAELLQEAQSDLEEANKFDPNNPQVYRYLAEVFVREGEVAASRGNLDQKSAAERRVDDVLAEAVRVAGDVPETHVNLLTRRLAAAQQGSITAVRERMKALEGEYQSLTRNFASSAQVFAAQGKFYSFYAAYLDSADALAKLDRAIQATEQAAKLDNENIEYPMLTAGYHYRKFSVYGDVPSLSKATELTEQALKLPGAQDRSGPLQFANRVHRLALCSLLGKCCIERLLTLPVSDPTREGLVARVEKAVHEIGQLRGGGEDPEVIKWQGMLDLAKGRVDKAVPSLYMAYQQIKAANIAEQRDPFLAWTLAKIFEGTPETGAVIDFLGTALGSGIVFTRPDTLLDYGDALLRAGSYDSVLNIVNVFQERFGASDRSKVLGIRTLIAKGALAKAQEQIAALDPGDPKSISLDLDLTRARANHLLATVRRQGLFDRGGASAGVMNDLGACVRREAELVGRLLQVDPGRVQENQVAELCESLLAQGDVDVVRAVVDAFLCRFRDNATALFYQALLSEPDPRNCPSTRRMEIQEHAARAITDPVQRDVNLALFYEQIQQLDRAVSQWRGVLDVTASGTSPDAPAYTMAGSSSSRQMAAGHLFDLACRQKNWMLAREMVEIAKRDNLDECGGHLFAARLALARKEYDAALSHLDECLKLRPIFSYGYVLRSEVKAALGREQASIEDARRASALNPMDSLVAKRLAQALYARNGKLGERLSSDQKQETKQALEQAIRLDPRDPSLLNAYVDFLSESDPEKVVALRQTIQTSAPSVDNALRLGKLATEIGLNTKDPTKQNAFFKIEETAFEQARELDPGNQSVLEAYADSLHARGQNDRAGQLLIDAKNNRLLWRHYLRVGRYAEAMQLLETMHGHNDTRIEALKGLLLVAQTMSDRAAVQKYSEELVSLEDNAVNRLTQMQSYLSVGLVTETEQRLRTFREKYPGDPRATLMEALLAAARNRYAEAIDCIDECIESAGPRTDVGLEYTARKAEILTAAYNATSDKMYLRNAIGVYESLREKWPKNSSVLNNLAYLLAQNDEKLAEALECARTAVEQNPDEANYLDTYGYLLYRSGKPAQAVRPLAAAVQRYEVRGKASMDVYEHVGLVQEALGDRGKALEAYRRALDIGGTTVSEAAKQRIRAAIGRLQ